MLSASFGPISDANISIFADNGKFMKRFSAAFLCRFNYYAYLCRR